MKRSIAAILISAALIGGPTACRPGNNNPLTEDVFKVTVEKQFTIAKQKVDVTQVANIFNPPINVSALIFPQNEEGNAAEIYWNVLKKYQGAEGVALGNKLIEDLAPVIQVFELAAQEQDKVKLSAASLDVVKAEAQKAADIPELLEIEKGAKRKTARFVGAVIPVPDYILATPSLPGNVVNCLAGALMAKALLKEAAGDKAAAENLIQTIIAFGNHISQDASYNHFFTGQAIVRFGCFGLSSFYSRNNPGKKDAVDLVVKSLDDQAQRLGQLQARDETNQPFNTLSSLGYLDDGVDVLAVLATNENIPSGIRARIIENIFTGYMFRYFMADRSGRPPETTEYAPPSEKRLQALKKLATLPDKTLAELASKSEQMLSKLAGMSSGDRLKYWRENSKPKAS